MTLRSTRQARIGIGCGVMLLLASSGCGGEEFERLERPTEAAVAPVAAAGAGAGATAEGEKAKREPAVYRDEDFVESEKNRDPFRSYIRAFRAQAPDEIQRRVVMPTTSIEEMKLVAIVGGIARPKAMLLDPMQVGHVVERGVYIGRPKLVQATGSVAMVLNWRVDRIRENELVLTRQDPTDPTRPALTRVMQLNEPDRSGRSF